MQIHILKDEKFIDAVNNDAKWLPVQENWEKDDIIVCDGERLVFFEIDSSVTQNEKYVRRLTDLGGTCSSFVRLFDKMYGTYYECMEADRVLKEYPTISKENLYDSMQKLIERVKKHGKLDSKQEKILLDVYCHEKTKRQLVSEGLCTYREIDEAHSCFIDEAQWCFGFKNSWNMSYAKQFNVGENNFCFSPNEFSALHNIDTSLLRRMVKGLLDGQTILAKDEVREIAYSIVDDNYLWEMSEDAKKSFRASVDKIVQYYLDAELEHYSTIARTLEKSNINHIDDIRKYCAENGHNYWRTTRCMKKLGIHIDHHSRNRSKRLKDYLE